MRQSMVLLLFSLLLTVPISALALNCGGLNQRPCNRNERMLSCNRGLVENILSHRCVRPPKKINPINLSPQKNALTRLSQQRRLPVRFRATVKRIIREVDHANKLIQKISELSGNPQKNRDKLRIAVRQLQAKQKKLQALQSVADGEIDKAKNDIEDTKNDIKETKERFKYYMHIIIENMELRYQTTRSLLGG